MYTERTRDATRAAIGAAWMPAHSTRVSHRIDRASPALSARRRRRRRRATPAAAAPPAPSGGSGIGRALGGALAGATAGAALGPLGMAGGAIIGGLISLFG